MDPAKKIYKQFLIIISFLLIAGLGADYCNTIISHEAREGTIIVIQNNSSISEIAQLLEDNKVIKEKRFFTLWIRFIDLIKRTDVIAGEYNFSRGDDFSKIIEKITKGEVVTRKVTIPEGCTIFEIAEIMGNSYGINSEEGVLEKFKEGSIFPDTYFYHYGTNAYDILNRAKKSMNKFLDSAWNERDRRIDTFIRNKSDALILASIIEEEASINEEKPLISSVYINRLKNKMLLQADPTIIYGLRVHNGNRDSKRINFVSSDRLKFDSPYNTYKYLGLPPTPICNPSKKSIEAALHPANTDFLYFVADGKGGHLFSSKYSKHLKNVNIYRKTALYMKLKKGSKNIHSPGAKLKE